MSYIYKIVNDINDKIYIGKTDLSIEKRFKEHLRAVFRRRDGKRPLYSAMRKYGIEHFHIELVEETDNPKEREKYWIEYYGSYHNGYNATIGGDGRPWLNLPEEEIVDYYQKNNITLNDLAQQYNCDKLSIKKVLKKNNIQIKPANDFKRNKRKVAMIDKDNEEVLAIYDSIDEAEKLHPTGRHISATCSGKRMTAGGYKWKYID